jgi:hypothetical protein
LPQHYLVLVLVPGNVPKHGVGVGSQTTGQSLCGPPLNNQLGRSRLIKYGRCHSCTSTLVCKGLLLQLTAQLPSCHATTSVQHMHARGHMSNGSAVSKYSSTCAAARHPSAPPETSTATTHHRCKPAPLRKWRFKVVGTRLVPVDRVVLTRQPRSSRKV